MGLAKKTARTIAKRGLLEPGETVVVSVSGGPDSTCLMYILNDLKEGLGLTLYAAHVNHMLRGEESEAEEEFVRKRAEDLGLELFVARLDPEGLKSRPRHSLQSAAREERRAFLRDVAEETGATKAALGHTADDRAEEVLMRLIRGSGLTGLSGMRPISEGFWIRPLIEAAKHEVLAYLESKKIPYMVDSSNLREDYLRNRVRLRLLEVLKEEFNPNIRETLARTAEILTEDEEFMDLAARKAAEGLVSDAEHGVSVDLIGLKEHPPAIQRRVVRLAFARLASSLRRLTFDHVAEVLGLATGKELHLPGGVRAQREYENLLIYRHPPREGFDAPHFEVSIPGPGAYPIPELEKTLVLNMAEGCEKEGLPPHDSALFDPERISFPLTLRSPRPGDRVHLGARGGTKKLSDLWGEAKMPRRKRRELAVLTQGEKILWVPGLYTAPGLGAEKKAICLGARLE